MILLSEMLSIYRRVQCSKSLFWFYFFAGLDRNNKHWKAGMKERSVVLHLQFYICTGC